MQARNLRFHLTAGQRFVSRYAVHIYDFAVDVLAYQLQSGWKACSAITPGCLMLLWLENCPNLHFRYIGFDDMQISNLEASGFVHRPSIMNW